MKGGTFTFNGDSSFTREDLLKVHKEMWAKIKKGIEDGIANPPKIDKERLDRLIKEEDDDIKDT